MFQACLCLLADAIKLRISLVRPSLRPFLSRAKITDPRVGNASADLVVVRHEHDVTVNVLRRNGAIDAAVLM
jgi:hypothetical protein